MTRAEFQKCFNKGRRLAGKRRFSEAIQYFEAALQFQPTNVDTIFQLGNVSKAMGLYDVAIKWYDIASQLKPDSIEIAFNRGNALQLAGREQEALDTFLGLAPLMENDPILWNSLGSLYQQMSQTTNAMKALEKAVELKPNYFEAWNNLALTYFVGRSVPKLKDKWIGAFKKAERGYVKDPHFFLNRATCHFWSGHYEEGWADYAHRHHPLIKASVNYQHKIQRWKGEDLSGKTILIGEEQGIGDQITFASAIADIAKTAHRVILEANPKIVALLQNSFPNISVVAPDAETIDLKRHHSYEWLTEPVDYFAPLGDAFYYCRPSKAALENSSAFLKADPVLSNKWVQRLADMGPKPKVGISWRSSNMAADRQGGYLTLDALTPLLTEMSGFQFINIQYGDCAEELAALPPSETDTPLVANFEDLDLFDDIDGTAALIDNLDFVLSVRNTQACLAGALGKKTMTYHGSFLQFGRTYTDPIFPELLTMLPHDDELPILEQFRNALLDFEQCYHEALQRDLKQDAETH